MKGPVSQGVLSVFYTHSVLCTHICMLWTDLLAFHVKSLRRFKQGRYMVIFVYSILILTAKQRQTEESQGWKQGGH